MSMTFTLLSINYFALYYNYKLCMSIIVSNLNTTFFTMHVLALGHQLADDHTGGTRRGGEDNRLAMVELRLLY